MNRAEPAEWSKLLREQSALYEAEADRLDGEPAERWEDHVPRDWHALQARRFRAAALLLETGETGCSEPVGATAGIPEPATTDGTAPATAYPCGSTTPRAGR